VHFVVNNDGNLSRNVAEVFFTSLLEALPFSPMEGNKARVTERKDAMLTCSPFYAILNALVLMPFSYTTFNDMSMSVIYLKQHREAKGALVVSMRPLNEGAPWFIQGLEPFDVRYYDNNKKVFKTDRRFVTFDFAYPWNFSIPCDRVSGAFWVTVEFGACGLRSGFIPIE
jgi:hypothetical protein